jgi:hypothetical protein
MYWENKCFFCIFFGALAAIVALSAKPIYKDIKNSYRKNEKTTVTHISKQNSDSTSINY